MNKWEKKNIVNNLYENKTQAELASFLHATCFNPVKPTFIKAVKNGKFSTWPGLVNKLISARLPKSEADIFVNSDRTQKYTRSTKSKQLALEAERDFSRREGNTNYLFVTISIADPCTGKVYTHLTGCLPVTSDRGM